MYKTLTLSEKIAIADTHGGNWLAKANEASEAGKKELAERLYAKVQYWLDRSNTLRGCGE